MFKMFFLLAGRNLAKRKFYSIIELTGLSVGIACFMIMLAHVKNEISFDRFFDRSGLHLSSVPSREQVNRYSSVPSALAVHAQLELPQVEKVVRIFFPY